MTHNVNPGDTPTDPPADPLPNPEPSVPSLDEPDPGVFHHEPVKPREPVETPHPLPQTPTQAATHKRLL
jgi:hypothetical protein